MAASLEERLKELSSAEDFLEFLNIEYDPHIVRVNRLHILQRFRDYLEKNHDAPANEVEQRARYAHLLQQAYEDFTRSDALTEKVFPVFHKQSPAFAAIPVSAIARPYKKPD